MLSILVWCSSSRKDKRRSITKGGGVTSVTKAIVDRTHMTANHAKLIANDQTGSIISQLDSYRAKRAGARKYIWRSMEDNRVRPKHRELDGTEQVYGNSDGGDDGQMPGEPIRCRCVALPVFDESSSENIVRSGAKYYPAYDESEMSMGQEMRRQNLFARTYYKQMRRSDRQAQIDKVVNYSHLSKNIVTRTLIHVLDSQYDLFDYRTMTYTRSKFAPDIDMAHSLQRLINGNPMKHDILLLKHGALEAKLMDDPNGKYYGNYIKAHKKANVLYNYQDECIKLRNLGILSDYEKDNLKGDGK